MKGTKISYGIVGLVGLLCVVAITASWLFAAIADTTWVFGSSMISDLGVSDVEVSKTLFNYGMCAIGGVLAALFGLLLLTKDRTSGGMIFGALIVFAGICLVGIGFIHEGQDLHYPLAVALGIFVVFAALAQTCQDWNDKRYIVSGIGIISILVGLYLFFCATRASMECWAVVLAVFYIFVQSMKYTFKTE